jgi:glucose-6-phosphate-specific signal transduction histidine kinase
MTKVITSHKKFLIYITTLILWTIPLVMDVPSGTYEIIWLIYLIPPILITFHHGYKGGIVAGLLSVLLSLSFEVREYFLHSKEYNNGNFIVVLAIAAGVTAVTLGMGTLLRNVEREKKKLEKAIDRIICMRRGTK